jgi:hypothetical protein
MPTINTNLTIGRSNRFIVLGKQRSRRIRECYGSERCILGQPAPRTVAPAYFRRRRARLRRFAFAATRRRYPRTISSTEAPASKRVPASKAASIFSVTISSASRRACLPPRISFIIRSPTTWFASTASFITELNTRRPFICRIKIPPWSTISPRKPSSISLGSAVCAAHAGLVQEMFPPDRESAPLALPAKISVFA